MTDNMFDNFVRDKLKDHQSPVPQGLWEKIERRKDSEPKGGFWLSRTTLFGGLLFIVLSMGAGYFLLQDTTPGESNTPQLSETAAAKNGSVTSNTEANTATNPAGNQDQNNNEGNTPVTSNTGINGDHDGNKTGAVPGTGNDDIASTVKTNKNNHSANQSIAANTNDKNNAAKTNYANRQKQDNSGLLLNKGAQKQKTNNASGGTFTSNIKVDAGAGISATPITDNILSLSKGVTAYDLRTFSLGTKDKFDLSQIRIFGIDCPTAGRPRRNDWYLEVYGSPDIAMKSVSAKSNPAYVQKKDSTESTQLGYTAGFRISKSIGDNLLVKAGLQYSQINERFDLRTENERRITTVITIRTVQTAAGTDTTVRDTTTLMQIGYNVQRTYNRYRSIDIPLLLSYEFGNENWKFGLNAGVILNLHSWYNGQTLNDSLNVVSLNSKNNAVYKQNIGLGVYAGFSIIKPVSNKFDVFAEPYFRYNLSNMAKGSAYTQKFNAAGISLGIRYRLKGQRNGIK
jgi:hypothetical protein